MTGEHRPLHGGLQHVHGPFGVDAFGRRAEAFARFFGTPRFLIGQTALVVVWIALNVVGASQRWDPYPFILLNLVFSLQAAYAAPLILLAQTRQADRDKAMSDADVSHRDSLARAAIDGQVAAAGQLAALRGLLEENSRLTAELVRLTADMNARIPASDPGA